MPRLTGVPAVALLTLTAVVLALTGISGYVRAEFADRDEFAQRVASAVDEPAVRTVLAERVVDGLTPIVAADALAVRPLLVAAVSSLARTEPFRRAVLELAGRRHGALVDGDGGVVFDLAARGGVLLDTVRSISPRTADAIPSGIALGVGARAGRVRADEAPEARHGRGRRQCGTRGAMRALVTSSGHHQPAIRDIPSTATSSKPCGRSATMGSRPGRRLS